MSCGCQSGNGGAGDQNGGGSMQSTEQVCFPIDYVPYCLPGMPMQIIYTQLPGNPMFVPPCPPFCPMTDPCCGSNGNGNGHRNGNGRSSNGNGRNGNGSGKRDGLQY